MQLAKGEPGAERHAEAVATKADSAHTDPATPELPVTGLSEPSIVDTPTVNTLTAGGSTVGAPAGSAAVPGTAFGAIRLPPPRRRPPAASRADLFGAISMVSLVSLTGLPIGWLWSRFAPAQLSIMQEDRSLAALPIESQHRFDDLATFVMLGAMAGLLIGALAWLVRGRRGPLTAVGLAAGSLLAAWLAVRIGVSLAHARYAQPPSLLIPGALVAVAPRIESDWVIVVQPLFAVVAYGIAAAANGLEDLGRRLT